MGTDALDAMLYALSSGEAYTRIASYNGCPVETYTRNETDGIEWPRLSIDNWSATVEAYMQFFENIANHPIKFDTYVIDICPNKRVAYLAAFMQKLLVSEYGYRKLGECEYWENTNYVCAYSLLNKIKKHPLLWKLFFMIA